MILIRGGTRLQPFDFLEFHGGEPDKVVYYEIFIIAENVQSILLGDDGNREFLVPHWVDTGLI